jgi:TnsA-like endonuclease N terminal
VSVRYRRVSGEFVDTALDRLSVNEVTAGRPVREFRSYRGRRHYSGWYWSATVGNLLAYESRLELARVMLADFDPDVTAIAAQPFQLAGLDRGELRRHVPDLLFETRDGAVTVVDVKPERRLSDPKVSAVFAWTREVVAWRGWAFEVWSGAETHLLVNVRFLAGYRRSQVINRDLVSVVLAAAAEQPTIGAIERAVTPIAPVSVVRPVLLHLLWSGVVTADLSIPLNAETPVQARPRGDRHE